MRGGAYTYLVSSWGTSISHTLGHFFQQYDKDKHIMLDVVLMMMMMMNLVLSEVNILASDVNKHSAALQELWKEGPDILVK